jgi:hypothetical protein
LRAFGRPASSGSAGPELVFPGYARDGSRFPPDDEVEMSVSSIGCSVRWELESPSNHTGCICTCNWREPQVSHRLLRTQYSRRPASALQLAQGGVCGTSTCSAPRASAADRGWRRELHRTRPVLHWGAWACLTPPAWGQRRSCPRSLGQHVGSNPWGAPASRPVFPTSLVGRIDAPLPHCAGTVIP